jgi:hypothetical protein
MNANCAEAEADLAHPAARVTALQQASACLSVRNKTEIGSGKMRR